MPVISSNALVSVFDFVLVRRDRLRQHVDLHAAERLRRFHEPFHFGELLFLGQRGRLKLAVHPASCFVHAGDRRTCPISIAARATVAIKRLFIESSPR